MDIKRKIDLAEQHVRSISRHDDEDMAVRSAALAKVAQFIDAERKAMGERVQARIAVSVGETPVVPASA